MTMTKGLSTYEGVDHDPLLLPSLISNIAVFPRTASTWVYPSTGELRRFSAKKRPVLAYSLRSPRSQEALQGVVQCFNNVSDLIRRWNALANYARRFLGLAIPASVYNWWGGPPTSHLCRVERANDGSPVLRQIAHRHGNSFMDDYTVVPLDSHCEQIEFLLNLIIEVIAPPAPNVADQKYCIIRPSQQPNTCTIYVSSPPNCAGKASAHMLPLRLPQIGCVLSSQRQCGRETGDVDIVNGAITLAAVMNRTSGYR